MLYIYVNLFRTLCELVYRWSIKRHRKTPVLESLFNKVESLKTLLKSDSSTSVFLWVFRNLTSVISHPLKWLKKLCLFWWNTLFCGGAFSNRIECLLKIFDVHFEMFGYMRRSLHITRNPKVFSTKTNASYIVWTISLWRPLHRIIQLHSQTAFALSLIMVLHSSQCHKGVMTFFVIISPLFNTCSTL